MRGTAQQRSRPAAEWLAMIRAATDGMPPEYFEAACRIVWMDYGGPRSGPGAMRLEWERFFHDYCGATSSVPDRMRLARVLEACGYKDSVERANRGMRDE